MVAGDFLSGGLNRPAASKRLCGDTGAANRSYGDSAGYFEATGRRLRLSNRKDEVCLSGFGTRFGRVRVIVENQARRRPLSGETLVAGGCRTLNGVLCCQPLRVDLNEGGVGLGVDEMAVGFEDVRG